MQQIPSSPPVRGDHPSDHARLQAVIDWERRLHHQRPGLRDEVREAAYDKAVDALLSDDALGRDAHGRPSRGMVNGLADRCLGWKRAEDLRRRLTSDGQARRTPRAARSLDAPLSFGLDDQDHTFGDRVVADQPATEDVVHWRLQLAELVRRAAADGELTRDVVGTYLFGGDCNDVAERHGVATNTVHQTKSRFASRNPGLAR
jgi:hypothetical protein